MRKYLICTCLDKNENEEVAPRLCFKGVHLHVEPMVKVLQNKKFARLSVNQSLSLPYEKATDIYRLESNSDKDSDFADGCITSEEMKKRVLF
jgi:hypothetical protein